MSIFNEPYESDSIPGDASIRSKRKSKYVGEKDIVCAGCDNIIAKVLVLDGDLSKEHSYKAICPCGDTSFIVRVNGETRIGPADGYEITEVYDSGQVFTIKLVKGK